jgi:hypothetical protein
VIVDSFELWRGVADLPALSKMKTEITVVTESHRKHSRINQRHFGAAVFSTARQNFLGTTPGDAAEPRFQQFPEEAWLFDPSIEADVFHAVRSRSQQYASGSFLQNSNVNIRAFDQLMSSSEEAPFAFGYLLERPSMA